MQDHLFGPPADERERRCRQLIERCGYAAAALTILPIPGSELLGVMPIHVGMVIGVGHEYGTEITKEHATQLLVKIGATVGLSLVGSRLAMTAGKILLPGLGGLVAAPFMFASTLALGTVARLYFASDGKISNDQMKAVYERAVDNAKKAFDPTRARSDEARDMAERARDDEGDSSQSSSSGPRPSMDDLAERLAKLDELLEKGSITDAEHQQRRQRILDEV